MSAILFLCGILLNLKHATPAMSPAERRKRLLDDARDPVAFVKLGQDLVHRRARPRACLPQRPAPRAPACLPPRPVPPRAEGVCNAREAAVAAAVAAALVRLQALVHVH